MHALEQAERDEDDVLLEKSVPMNRFTLTFPEVVNEKGDAVDFETRYVHERQNSIGNEVRVPVALAAFFFLIEAVLEWSTYDVADPTPIFAIR